MKKFELTAEYVTNIFGKSYEYRKLYNEYKERRKAEDKKKKDGQMTIDEFLK